MRIAIQNRWIKDFQIEGTSGQVKEICHLLYADDTIIFCEPWEDQIRFIETILLFFEASLGMKVSWGKSNLFPVKKMTNILNLTDILGCKVESLPTLYLGMPLGNKHKGYRYLGWHCGENRKEISKMEGSIYVIGRQIHPHQFSARLSSYLCHVTISITCQCFEEIGQI